MEESLLEAELLFELVYFQSFDFRHQNIHLLTKTDSIKADKNNNFFIFIPYSVAKNSMLCCSINSRAIPPPLATQVRGSSATLTNKLVLS